MDFDIIPFSNNPSYVVRVDASARLEARERYERRYHHFYTAAYSLMSNDQVTTVNDTSTKVDFLFKFATSSMQVTVTYTPKRLIDILSGIGGIFSLIMSAWAFIVFEVVDAPKKTHFLKLPDGIRTRLGLPPSLPRSAAKELPQ